MSEPFDDEVEAALGRLSYQDQQRVLRNLIWDVFGDVDEGGRSILIPERGPDKVDVLSLCTSLRQELWPGRFPDGDAPADADYDDTPGPASFSYRGWTVEEAIDALMAYDQGCTDSGVRDADMKEAVRGYLGGTAPAALASFIAEFVEEHYESDAARRAGYGPDDAEAFRAWLRDGLGLSLPPAPPV